jgi:hypothetical protein
MEAMEEKIEQQFCASCLRLELAQEPHDPYLLLCPPEVSNVLDVDQRQYRGREYPSMSSR